MTSCADWMSLFQLKIIHLQGKDLRVVDYFSRDPSGTHGRKQDYKEKFVIASVEKLNEALGWTRNLCKDFLALNGKENDFDLKQCRTRYAIMTLLVATATEWSEPVQKSTETKTDALKTEQRTFKTLSHILQQHWAIGKANKTIDQSDQSKNSASSVRKTRTNQLREQNWRLNILGSNRTEITTV